MATEEGTVIKVAGANALVKTTRSSSCEHCSSKGSCMSKGGGNEMEVQALNLAGAREGDRVKISFDTASLLKASFLLYVFPILCLIAGALGGQQLSSSLTNVGESLLAVICGLAAFGLSFFVVRRVSNKMAVKSDYQPKVIRIL